MIVSAIGPPPALIDASRHAPTATGRILAGAIGQGLVRFDAAGQIEPGIAERWTVIDDGMSYIFRLRRAQWPDGKPVTATEVVAALKHQLAPASRNPLAPFLSAVEEVVEMTPEVIEVHLARPRPDLLKLFAQPELAIVRARPLPAGGSGPFRLAAGGEDAAPMLKPAIDPDLDPQDTAPARPEDNVQLIGERAALAITRFQQRRSDLVTGGTFLDWPLLATVGVSGALVRTDPAAGLFGLQVVSRDGFLADAAHREALASVFDRAALTSALTPEWSAAEQLLPETLDSAAAPTVPAWAATPLAERRARAAALVAAWREQHAGSIVLRIALPAGPGANLLWGQLAATLLGIGVQPQRVTLGSAADLSLVDQVAPYDSARWYLATACRPCSVDAAAKVEAARLAPTLADRARAIADADAAIAADVPLIILARPLRWSLVSPRLRTWAPNTRAWHPLNHLRPATT